MCGEGAEKEDSGEKQDMTSTPNNHCRRLNIMLSILSGELTSWLESGEEVMFEWRPEGWVEVQQTLQGKQKKRMFPAEEQPGFLGVGRNPEFLQGQCSWRAESVRSLMGMGRRVTQTLWRVWAFIPRAMGSH